MNKQSRKYVIWCAEGYMGPRCEYKDLDRSYLLYIHYKRKSKQSRASTDCVDSPSITLICRPTFGTRWRNPPQVDLPIPHDRGDSKQNKIELHQVTTITQCTNNRDM
ncbi:hypothetical protein MML48_1g04188 [Holotrichia oblita]|uniref:Uncharacterized protein n=1 Tax=Holotrichia oblita TaxID=644536 RepID=A0ACB9TW05_HOLOL|nr:hypothetical protein MML48_1g04188 [Holotrichia oblita]